MIRKVLLGAGALALGLGATLTGAQGIAGATPPVPVTLSGPVTCSVTGLLKFSPGLTNGGTTATTISVEASLAGCSGAGTTGSGANVVSGKLVVASSTTVASDCGAILNGSFLPDLAGSIVWKSTGAKVVPSAVTVTGATAYYDVNGNPPGGDISVGLPTTVTGGSYASETGTFAGLDSNSSGYLLDSHCGTSRGLKSVKFGKPMGEGLTGTVTVEVAG
jgi:hypothetical protein